MLCCFVLLCRDVLGWVVLCCVVALRCVVLCCPVLCRAVPCRTVPCWALRCCAQRNNNNNKTLYLLGNFSSFVFIFLCKAILGIITLYECQWNFLSKFTKVQKYNWIQFGMLSKLDHHNVVIPYSQNFLQRHYKQKQTRV